MPRRHDDARTTPPAATVGRRRLAALAVAGLAMLGACSTEGDEGDVVSGDVGAGEGVQGPGEEVPIGGEDPTLADDGIDPGDEEDAVRAELDITAGVADDTDARGQALLSCGPDGATGVLWLDGAAAEEACRALQDPSLLGALDPPPDDQMCAEIYGGPDVATIVGTVDGVQVDAVVDRADGCAIERWDLLAPLLPVAAG